MGSSIKIILVIMGAWLFWAMLPLAVDRWGFTVSIEKLGAWGDTFGALNAAFSAVAVLGVLLTLRMQSQELSDQQKQIDDQNKRFDAAELTTKRQLRAYLTIEQSQLFCDVDGNMAPFIQVGAHAICVVRLKNCGLTPARNVRVRLLICLRQTQPPPSDFPNLDMTISSTTNLGPQSATNSDAVSPGVIDHATFQQVIVGSQAIFVHGLITYEDVFGDSHWTNFRLRNKPGQNDGAMTFTFDGNDIE